MLGMKAGRTGSSETRGTIYHDCRASNVRQITPWMTRPDLSFTSIQGHCQSGNRKKKRQPSGTEAICVA
jgi:hypothetical protein